MSKKPSDTTLLKHARSEIRKLEKQLGESKIAAREYRERATKAEQEVAEWKRRFDALLARDAPCIEGVSGSATEGK